MTVMDFAFAVWETFYITVLSTAFALVLGLPLGVLLVAGDKDGVLPLPGWLMHALNFVINILRSIPFLILMICVFPLSRLIVGTTVGTNATIVPLVAAGRPFVAGLGEARLRELDAGRGAAGQLNPEALPGQLHQNMAVEKLAPEAAQGEADGDVDVPGLLLGRKVKVAVQSPLRVGPLHLAGGKSRRRIPPCPPDGALALHQ